LESGFCALEVYVHKVDMLLDGINCKGFRMLFSVLQNLILVSFHMVLIKSLLHVLNFLI